MKAVGAGLVAVSTEPAKRKAVTRFGLDIKKAQSMLEYCPQVTLDDGLRQMVLN
jgi:nucleoside-diphosphate-sugar epimerase